MDKKCGCKKCTCKNSVKIDSFAEFVKNEASAIYDGTKSPDFQWSGSPQSMIRPKKKSKL